VSGGMWSWSARCVQEEAGVDGLMAGVVLLLSETGQGALGPAATK
jgi:hypothetical protein